MLITGRAENMNGLGVMPRKKRIIKLSDISLREKDILVVESREDFEYLTKESEVVWEYKDLFMDISNEFVIQYKKEENGGRRK